MKEIPSRAQIAAAQHQAQVDPVPVLNRHSVQKMHGKSPIPQYYNKDLPVKVDHAHKRQKYSSMVEDEPQSISKMSLIRSGGYGNHNLASLKQPSPPQVYSRI